LNSINVTQKINDDNNSYTEGIFDCAFLSLGKKIPHTTTRKGIRFRGLITDLYQANDLRALPLEQHKVGNFHFSLDAWMRGESKQ
jgi:hypothetical protein